MQSVSNFIKQQFQTVGLNDVSNDSSDQTHHVFLFFPGDGSEDWSLALSSHHG